ncbi:MAG: SapC family protein, partial [Pseudomonadota bacterium]
MERKKLVPVTVARHGNMYWKRFSSYAFAADLTETAVVSAEIPQTAAAFPIVFREIDEKIGPVAILSLVANRLTPFVSSDGQWLAT